MAAGCIFTRALFKEIPYDPNYYFYGEELSMALELLHMAIHFFIFLMHLYFISIQILSNIPRKTALGSRR